MTTTSVSDESLLTPPKLRRRPVLIALGVVLIVVSAVVAWYVVAIVKDTVQVVAAVVDIPRGSVLERHQLTTVEIRPDPLLKTIAAADLEQLIGQRAVADISAGVIVAPAAVSQTLLPEAGQAMVGLRLESGQLPATLPRHGQPITVTSTPADNGDPNGPFGEKTFAAVVVNYSEHPDQGYTVLDVVVPVDQAASLAGVAATGRVAVFWNAE
ncbi:MAG: SAF domain-containing protein [Propionibacteriaceae bacterium]|nr:SAF domain-containing protein [Propionibacteriaceae bacterium]